MPPEPRIAFYAPLKAPTHPVPSGDRTIARLLIAALTQAGFRADLASALRSLDADGDRARQARVTAEAAAAVARLAEEPRPALWFTYHCHYKAPDLLGPALSKHFAIPYVIAEPSHAPRRLDGPWASFAAASARAIRAADRLFWTTPRDRPALAGLVGEAPLVPMPAFVDPGPAPHRAQRAEHPLRLLTVAMMRPGDKHASYRALAAGLAATTVAVSLDVVGDGPARAEIAALLAPFSPRWHGAITDPAQLRALYEAADVMLWPGIGEGVGMVYLEAQAAGLPCIAERRAAQEAVLSPTCWLVEPGDPAALAAALAEAAGDRGGLAARGEAARAHVLARHSLDAAAATLRATLMPLIGDRR